MFAKPLERWKRFRFGPIVLELAVSVCLASLVWVYIHNRVRNSIDSVAVPVQVQLAADQRDQFVLEISESRTVLASFTGPHALIRDIRRKLQRGLLKANLTLTVPEEKRGEAMFSEMLHVDEDAIAVSVGVKVEIVEENIPITVHRLTERTLPVKLESTGDALRVADQDRAGQRAGARPQDGARSGVLLADAALCRAGSRGNAGDP